MNLTKASSSLLGLEGNAGSLPFLLFDGMVGFVMMGSSLSELPSATSLVEPGGSGVGVVGGGDDLEGPGG